MAASKPRIAFTNYLHDYPEIWATTEETAHPVENLLNWRPGDYWKPTWVTQTPGDQYVYMYPVDGNLVPNNFYMRDWSAGASAAPDAWTLVGAGASVSRQASLADGIGQYSARITRNGADCWLQQSLPTTQAEAMRGFAATAQARLTCSVANRARIGIYDGSTTTWSSYHSGGGTPEELEVTHSAVRFDTSTLQIRIAVDTGDTSADFDFAILVKGSTLATAPHAKSPTVLAIHDHNLGSTGATIALEASDDNSSWSAVTGATISPADDTTQWVDFSGVSKERFRVKISGGSARAEIGVLLVGTYIELPEFFDDGFDPNQRTLRARTKSTRHGTPIGRDIKRTPIRIRANLPWVDEAFVTGDLSDFWDHAGDSGSGSQMGLPFFLQWDDGDHGADTFYCQIPDGFALRAPLDTGLFTESLSLEFEAVSE